MGEQHISAIIMAAKGFSWEAAKKGQNPPHTVAEWEQVEGLWQQAIDQLKQIPENDLLASEAQRLLVDYTNNSPDSFAEE
ncbi:MAG: hypothetical protein F6K19_30985 [Cyanothece sp. SIO1E1]|nr:hypothetical protein [Cyanothece sp. SIO1E1]